MAKIFQFAYLKLINFRPLGAKFSGIQDISYLRRCSHSRTTSVILEITGGAGGSEAMIFADEMTNLYSKYLWYMKWSHSVSSEQNSDQGGIKYNKLIVDTPDCLSSVMQEAGVHRVQRVPKTEKYGRLHTSTITVSVLPQSVMDVKISDKDVNVQFKKSSGPGGQHVNKTDSAVVLTHRTTGIVVECQESRSQHENRQKAMIKLLKKIREIEMDKIMSQLSSLKKAQFTNANRNEKIRTYNFPQDRLTDHRLGKSYYNLRKLFDGDVAILDNIIKDFNR